MKIKAVIYDVDGTLIDSEPLHVVAWDRTLNQYGYMLRDLSREFVKTMAGKKPIVIAEDIVSTLSINVSSEEFLKTKTRYYLDSIKTNMKPMKGAIESVRNLDKSGIRLAIGTSLDSQLLRQILQTLGIDSYFEQIVTGDMIAKGKPDPETYLKVIAALGLSQDECVVIEDSQSGIESAKSAGVRCIALKNNDEIQQNTSSADVTINSLFDITPAFIQSIGASSKELM